MKTIDLTFAIPNIDGVVETQIVPVKYEEVVDDETVVKTKNEKMVLTLGHLLKHCLFQRDNTEQEEEILARLDLIDKIHNKESVELNETEIEMLKRLVIKKYDIFYAGSVLRILNK